MTSAMRRPCEVAAVAGGGTVSAGVGMESEAVTRVGAAGMTGCGAPDSKAASRARAVAKLDAAISPLSSVWAFSALRYSALARARSPCFSKVRPRPT